VVAAEVRPARPGEGARLGEIFLASGRAAWAGHLPAGGLAEVKSPEQDLEAQIIDPHRICLVAELEGEVVAFAVLCPNPDPDADQNAVALLDRMYTDPTVWGERTRPGAARSGRARAPGARIPGGNALDGDLEQLARLLRVQRLDARWRPPREDLRRVDLHRSQIPV
jgi:Acetyltransferase (GNAT) family